MLGNWFSQSGGWCVAATACSNISMAVPEIRRSKDGSGTSDATDAFALFGHQKRCASSHSQSCFLYLLINVLLLEHASHALSEMTALRRQ